MVGEERDTITGEPAAQGRPQGDPEEWGKWRPVPAGSSHQERLHGSLRPQERLSINTSGFSP